MRREGGRAGPGELAYRAGTYRSFLAGMARAVRRDARLPGLNVEARGDFTTALLGAWARVCDVLAFYQERIANEGYLGTATEPVSVVHLASAVGARRHPAIASRTHLAFQLIRAAGRPDRLLTDPAQPIVVQNAPGPNELPIVFECAERSELRAAWNAIPAALSTRFHLPLVWPGCRSVLLSGTAPGVRPGSGLLLSISPGADPGRSWLVVVDTVQIDRTRGCTLVTWSEGIPGDAGARPRPLEAVTLFPQTAGLFGRTAAAWSEVPEATKQAIGARPGGIIRFEEGNWRSAASTLPPGDLRVVSPNGNGLLAGTSRGLFGSSDGGVTWVAFPLPLGRHDVHSLLRGGDGRLYAGTGDGMVLTSGDGGESWTALPRTVVLPSGPRFGRDVLAFFHLLQKDPASLGQWILSTPIRALVLVPGSDEGPPNLYIGTDKGVFMMPVNGLYWRPFNGGDLPGHSAESGAADVTVRSMIALDGRLTAATDQGMFATRLRAADWTRLHPPIPLRATVNCVARDRTGDRIFVGTSVGVFTTSDRGRHWAPFTESLSAPVSAIAAFGDRIAAATPHGLYVSPAGAPQWSPADRQDLLLFTAGADLFDGAAADPVGPALRERFLRAGIRLDERLRIELLKNSANPVWEVRELSSGVHARVFRLRPGAMLEVSQLIRIEGGPTALFGTRDHLFALLPLGPPVDGEWPDFTNSGGELILDRKMDGLEDGSDLIVEPASSAVIPDPIRYRIRKSSTAPHKAFGKQATVTRILVDREPRLPSCDPRTTSVYAGPRPVLPFTGTSKDPRPVEGDRLRLSGGDGLGAGRWLQVSGPRAAAAILQPRDAPGALDPVGWLARIPAEAAPFLDQQMVSAGLKDAFAGGGVMLSLEWRVTVVDRGKAWLIRDGDCAWQIDRAPEDDAETPLRAVSVPIWEVVARPAGDGPREWVFAIGNKVQTAAAAAVSIAGESHEQQPSALTIVWQQACSSQKAVTEIVEITGVENDAAVGTFTFQLTRPLGALYDAAGCRVCANVVHATQGQTVLHEVLGSGAGTQTSQRFRLSNGPLTYLRDEKGTARPVLEVDIDSRAKRAIQFGSLASSASRTGVRWREVSSLAYAGAGSPSYELSTDEAGATIVTFGDGIYGARLPSGAENVTASYRAGAGACGNVPAGSLIALRKHQSGMASVTNPVRGSGGADAETIDGLRARAPRRMRHFDRVVTADDYRAAAMEAAGVKEALVDLVEGREGSTICVTVATEAAACSDEAASIRHALAVSIEAKRAAQLELRVMPPRRVPFLVRLALDLAPGADRVRGEEAVRAALFHAFGSTHAAIGVTVEPDRVGEIVKGVLEGAAASLLALHRHGQVRGIAPLVPARASLDPEDGQLHGAELLVIDSVEIVVRE